MSSLGSLLYQGQDAWGELRVYDNGARRLLAFGHGDEQSACLKSEPELLLFEYTQAMLLGLLLAPPHKVLCLGLGAGSLVNALFRHFKGINLTAVELRPEVVKLAKRYFYLPSHKDLQIHISEASAFIIRDNSHYDLIFCDLYTAEGAASQHSERQFLEACQARLQPEGVFVLNSWHATKTHNQVEIALLKSLYPALGVCLTREGNGILFGRFLPFPEIPQLKAKAQDLSRHLGFSLVKHLRNFRGLD